ncbi:hypothetical protein ACJVDH_08630 [Pedobacter sp. AW1-32]|uniref:hypothetical protein n=1 Tax=Pedobacter sp. AW1-32 TaxID=3383026 RepID=UPI003FED9FC1
MQGLPQYFSSGSVTHQQVFSFWKDEVKSACAELPVSSDIHHANAFTLIVFENNMLVLNLISVQNSFTATQLQNLQYQYQDHKINLIHLWEDVWATKRAQVIARIQSLLGFNTRLHGRKTKVARIDKPTADLFLDKHHLQGPVSSRYKFGLFLQEELVGVATFSALRKMKHSPNYTSAELIRFAIKSGFSVTGGLSKLLAHFKYVYHPNDIMSYADCDWSAGASYARLGFTLEGKLESQIFQLNAEWERSLIKDNTPSEISVFNTGSLKFILRY